MKSLTIKQALEQGYDLCGYSDRDYQNLMKISELNLADFKEGKILVAKKQIHSVSISEEQIREYLIDHYFAVDENPDDDYNDIQHYFKEQSEVISEFAEKMNAIYSKKWWRFLDSEIEIIL